MYKIRTYKRMTDHQRRDRNLTEEQLIKPVLCFLETDRKICYSMLKYGLVWVKAGCQSNLDVDMHVIKRSFLLHFQQWSMYTRFYGYGWINTNTKLKEWEVKECKWNSMLTPHHIICCFSVVYILFGGMSSFPRRLQLWLEIL